MQKNRKLLLNSTQPRLISSNDSTARNKKNFLSKNSEKSLKYGISSQKVKASEQSTGVENSQQKKSILQMQHKSNKATDSAEKSDSPSIVSTNNTEREIAETLYLLKQEISEWKAHESSRSRVEGKNVINYYTLLLIYFIIQSCF